VAKRRPLRGLLRRLVELSPADLRRYEARSVAEEMILRVLDTATKEGRDQLPAFNSVWDRAEGPVGRDNDDVAELHVKVIGVAEVVPAQIEQGDKPYGQADRALAEERAGGSNGHVLLGNGSARADLPGEG